jgi:hypothetical protein
MVRTYVGLECIIRCVYFVYRPVRVLCDVELTNV